MDPMPVKGLGPPKLHKMVYINVKLQPSFGRDKCKEIYFTFVCVYILY